MIIKLPITPYPAFVQLTQQQVKGEFYCAQQFADPVLANAAAFFKTKEGLPVTVTTEYTLGEKACFDDPEGYILTVTPQGAQIAASQPAGALYGAVTLALLARQGEVPCGVISDKPVWRHRGVQICYAQQNVNYRDAYLRHFIRAMAELKVNTVYLYLEWRYQFPSIPQTHNPEYLSPSQAAQLQQYAAGYHITLVPALNVLGHTSDFLAMQAFQNLSEYDLLTEDERTATGVALCTANPQVHRLMEKVLNDMMDAFDCPVIHVGGDEVAALGVCPHCQEKYGQRSKAMIYIDYYTRISRILKARGRKMGIWSDMLVQFLSEGDPSLLEAAQEMFDNTVIYDWCYDSAHTQAVEMLAKANVSLILSTSVHGCSVAAPWLGQTVNQHDYFTDGFRYDVMGGLATDWIYGHGYHGAQMGVLFATAEAMMWQGADSIFTVGATRDETCLSYALQTYGVGQPLVDYWHLAGDPDGQLLCNISPERNGSYLRRSVYLDDSPLGSFLRYGNMLRGEKLEQFRTGVHRAEKLWRQIETAARKTPDLYYLQGPVVLYRALLHKLDWANELYPLYDEAAQVQYTDSARFVQLLNRAAAGLRKHTGDLEEAITFARQMHAELGNEYGSVLRLENTVKNLEILADYLESLTDGHRPLPTFANMNQWLFARPLTNFWSSRCDEWFVEKPPFTRTDGDNGLPWGSARW